MKYEIEINGEIKTVEVKDKQVILLLQGCPSSGKSTFAEKLFQASKEHEDTFEDHKNKFVIVCRDDIRAAKGIKPIDFSREDEVSDEEISQAREILDLGYSLIVADTNLNSRYFYIWEELAEELAIIEKSKKDREDSEYKVYLRLKEKFEKNGN